jgi:hypothetical protein
MSLKGAKACILGRGDPFKPIDIVYDSGAGKTRKKFKIGPAYFVKLVLTIFRLSHAYAQPTHTVHVLIACAGA